MTNRELYIAVFHHEYGTDTFVFFFTPDGDLKYPSPRKVVEYFNIDFEPDKGERFELSPAHRSAPETLSAAAIGRKTMASASWWEDGEEGWYDEAAAEVSDIADLTNTTASPTEAAPAATDIYLPCFGITICLDRQPAAGRSGSGTIKSSLKLSVSADDVQYAAAIDGVESLVLAHACAGIDVATPAYIEELKRLSTRLTTVLALHRSNTNEF